MPAYFPEGELLAESSEIDFSTYTDEQLESSLYAIDRHRFEKNYLACRREIEKRKAAGQWSVSLPKPRDIPKMRKWLRGFALAQVIGAIFGIGTYLTYYGPPAVRGESSILGMILLAIALAMFTGTAWAALRYWRLRFDEGGFWRSMLYLQVPLFGLGRFGYEFYSGVKAPFGWLGQKISISVDFGALVTLYWRDEHMGYHFGVNLIAVTMIVLLGRAHPEGNE